MSSLSQGNLWLIIGGWLSVTAALLHLGCIVGGPSWYRFFGAGEHIAQAAARGSWIPVIITLGIATVLSIWAAYAFSGAGLIIKLPLLRTGLIVISAIYLLRGMVLFFPTAFQRPDLSEDFLRWSSVIVLAIGLVYAIGTWRAWNSLSGDA
ncbi:hypothetical protein [Blastomonas sp.]|uniref:hypothetical protein n=1 Tax=Blastomonas sp. TaxID=1909299 RepID=UPI0035933182